MGTGVDVAAPRPGAFAVGPSEYGQQRVREPVMSRTPGKEMQLIKGVLMSFLTTLLGQV